jgi:hypothetical protein
MTPEEIKEAQDKIASFEAFAEKSERNKRVQARYDALVAGGKGHYETLFRIVREEVEAERERCAKVAETQAGVPHSSKSDLTLAYDTGSSDRAFIIATAIRRG